MTAPHSDVLRDRNIDIDPPLFCSEEPLHVQLFAANEDESFQLKLDLNERVEYGHKRLRNNVRELEIFVRI